MKEIAFVTGKLLDHSGSVEPLALIADLDNCSNVRCDRRDAQEFLGISLVAPFVGVSQPLLDEIDQIGRDPRLREMLVAAEDCLSQDSEQLVRRMACDAPRQVGRGAVSMSGRLTRCAPYLC